MDINSLIQKIHDKLEQIHRLQDQINNKIKGLLSKVPGVLHWAVSKVEHLWQQFCDKMTDFWNWFTDKLAYVGDPFLLKDTGEKWNTKLGIPAHKRAKEVDADDLLVDDIWTGTGAEAYKNKIGDQKDALNSVGQNFASTIQGALNTMKTGIWVFWIGIVGGLVELIGGFVAGAIAEATVVGAGLGLAEQVLIVVVFLVLAGGATAALKFCADDSAASLKTVNSYYDDKWPSFALG